jgi:hypothetical protein
MSVVGGMSIFDGGWECLIGDLNELISDYSK